MSKVIPLQREWFRSGRTFNGFQKVEKALARVEQLVTRDWHTGVQVAYHELAARLCELTGQSLAAREIRFAQRPLLEAVNREYQATLERKAARRSRIATPKAESHAKRPRKVSKVA